MAKKKAKIRLKRRADAVKTNAVTSPTIYNQRTASKVLTQLVMGKTLKKICEMDGMPSRMSVTRWFHKYPDFRKRYNEAREIGMEAIADEIADIPDTYLDVQRARLKCEMMFKLMSKIAPRKWGDKITVNSDSDRPLRMKVEYVNSPNQNYDQEGQNQSGSGE